METVHLFCFGPILLGLVFLALWWYFFTDWESIK